MKVPTEKLFFGETMRRPGRRVTNDIGPPKTHTLWRKEACRTRFGKLGVANADFFVQ